MKLNKVVKKIAALGAGVAMLGATLLGAAADLSAYPAPFVQDGAFNGVIVVGDQAASEDVVGAIEIGMALQYAMKETQMTGCGTTDVTINDGVKIEKIGGKFQYENYVYDVDPQLDDKDLPVILVDGKYSESKGNTDNDIDYTQKLEFTNDVNAGVVQYKRNKDMDNKPFGDYLFFSQQKIAYTYELNFNDEMEYDTTSTTTIKEDVENTKIKIQGQDYTITNVKDDGANNIDEMTLMMGGTVIWLMQDQPITKIVDGTEHEVMVVDVTENEDSCGVSVDGTTAWIDVGSTETINGVEIGVTDAKAIHAQLQDVDVCELNVGASEIVLKDTAEVEVNGMKIDGSNTEIEAATDGKTKYIKVSYQPEDDIYLAEDESFIDPIFGNFKFVFAGMQKTTENIEFDSSSDEATLTFKSADGYDVEIPIVMVYEGDYATDLNGDTDNIDYSVLFGDDADYAGFGAITDDAGLVQAMFLDDGDVCTVNANQGCNKVKMLVISDDYVAHMFQVTHIDWTNQKVDLKDLTTGDTYTDKLADGTDIDVGIATIKLTLADGDGSGIDGSATDTLTATTINELLADTWDFETEKQGVIELSDVNGTGAMDNGAINVGDLAVIFGEDSDDAGSWNQETVPVGITYDQATDEQIEFSVTTTNLDHDGDLEKNSDYKTGATTWGTIVTWDDENDDSVVIEYPEEEADAQVFIAPVSAEISEEGGNIETTQINKINVGAAKLASEVTVGSKNMILVGGPCANDAAAEVMGVTAANCAEGFEKGKAMIKIYDASGKTALVVAGYEAFETKMATTVLADYTNPEYALEGDEVVITGTSLSDIQVGVPQ